MPTSQARIDANRRNSLKSCGPKTPEGKECSRRNGLKHGMTGRGIVLSVDDAAEVERRNAALTAEMAPKSTMGAILILQMATLSVRMEQGARREFASVAERVRHAATDYDVEQIERAEQLMAAIGDDPRGSLRRLKRFPAGVDLLLDSWRALRADLTVEGSPKWNGGRIVEWANLIGLREEDLRASRIESLTRATWGNFAWLAESDGAGLTVEARKAWACAQLVERIDAEIARLEAHYQTLDLEAFELDRAEAPDRALFDTSKPAILGRRYESEARRGFFRSLKDYRQAEAEVEAKEELVTPAPAPEASRTATSLGSSCEPAVAPAPAIVELAPPPLWPPSAAFSTARLPNGQILAVGKPSRGRA